MKYIKGFKIDPANKRAALIRIEKRPEAIRRVIKSREPVRRPIMEKDGKTIVAVIGAQPDAKTKAQWRVRGQEAVEGIGIIMAEEGNFACDVPIDAAWVARMIEWVQ